MKRKLSIKTIKIPKNPKSLNDFDLIELKWNDPQSDSSWLSYKQVEKLEMAVCHSHGRVFSYDKDTIKLFNDVNFNTDGSICDYGNITVIPRKLILSFRKIRD